jgi:hypothetical protein
MVDSLRLVKKVKYLPSNWQVELAKLAAAAVAVVVEEAVADGEVTVETWEEDVPYLVYVLNKVE